MQTEFRNEVPVARLHEGPLNPRKSYDPRAMAELVQSVKESGRILHPILVRPLVVAGSAKAAADFEIVCGHRRVRAAKAAGLQSVPAIIRELSDREVVETSLVELAQGAPVHPLEQAESMRVLVEQHGASTEELAAKLSKSVRWVQVQLQLCKLSKGARSAFLDGKLSASVASLLARLPDEKLQAAAMKRFAEAATYTQDDATGFVTFRAAAAIMDQEFMLALKDAPFDRASESLVRAAGSCVACPKRTGAQPELFADVKSPDICTDPKCFTSKVKAHTAQTVEDAKARGQEVLTEEEALKAWPQSVITSPAGFVELDNVCGDDPKGRTYRKLLGKYPDTVLAVNPHTGALHELVRVAGLKKTLKQAGHDFTKATPAKSTKPTAEPEVKTAAERLLEAVRVELVKRAAQQKPGVDFLRVVAGFMTEHGYTPSQPIIDARGWEDTPEWVDGAEEGELRAVVFDTAIDSVAFVTSDGALSEPLLALAKVYGVDVKDFSARLNADALFAPKESA